MAKMSRAAYANIYGPTRGDMVRLGDTSLLAEVEHDFAHYGDELTTGAGKCMRDGEGFQPGGTYASGALDMVVQNATIIDAVAGIVKGDIGIRDGKIVAIGKAGNPDVMNGVDPRLRCGPNTTVVHADGFIVTAGGIEAHAHFLSPQQCHHALAGGTTTMIGMSPGPHFDVSCSGPNILGQLIRAADEFPLNFGFLGRGCMDIGAVEESVAGGALGVKIHEDFGASPAVLDGSLVAADRNDFAVHIHTDTINEFGFCEDSLKMIGNRSVHMYHTEGSGGGHAPDLIRVNGMANVLPSSTNPTNPFTPAGLDEGMPMTMLAHFLNFGVPEDVAFAEMRVRPQTMAAEDILHDMGAISMFATDTQGMGRLAENIAKCWQLASVMKDRTGRLPQEKTCARGQRKDQALHREVHHQSGAGRRHRPLCRIDRARQDGRPRDLAACEFRHQAFPGHQGRLHDLVGDGRRQRQHFHERADGAKADVGRARPREECAVGHLRQPARDRKQRAAQARRTETDAADHQCAQARQEGHAAQRRVAAHNNDALPHIEVDPQTFNVYADGKLLHVEPATRVPLSRKYMLR